MRNESLRRRDRRAFTLVELLVVIGIIALLVSILLPTLGRAREQARSVKCMAQLRGYGNFIQMYANQNRNWLPCGWALLGLDQYGSDAAGFSQITGHPDPAELVNSDILKCPSAGSNMQVTNANTNYSMTYAFNRNMWWSYEQSILPNPTDPSKWGLTRITSPNVATQTALLFCTANYSIKEGGFKAWTDGFGWYPPLLPHGGHTFVVSPTATEAGVGGYFKEGKENVCFFDGHVESLPGDPNGTSDAAVPLFRPASGQRLAWNNFWNGKNNPN